MAECNEAEGLLKEMNLGKRVYDALGFLQGQEVEIFGDVMVDRVTVMNADLGEEDMDYLVDHQDEISAAFRDKVIFVFTSAQHPGKPGNIFFIFWSHGSSRWCLGWDLLGGRWGKKHMVIRRNLAKEGELKK